MKSVKKNTYNLAVTASYNHEDEWRRCCATVMGFEWVDHFDSEEEEEQKEQQQAHSDPRQEKDHTTNAAIQQVINLMEDDDDDDDDEGFNVDTTTNPMHKHSYDPWTENALRIQADLSRMARWIQSKQHEYVGLDMPDDEASLVQSTVTSFAATTAAELETLRKIIPNSSGNLSSHQNGIVQILLSQLQEQITEPFGTLQKQRTRISVQLWQNPWQCKLYQPKSKTAGMSTSSSTTMSQLFDDETDTPAREQRFLPREPLTGTNSNFLDNYHSNDPLQEAAPPCPPFMMIPADTNAFAHDPDTPTELLSSERLRSSAAPTPLHKDQQQRLQPSTQFSNESEQQQQWQDELQQEAVLLQESVVQNDLDSVQKMEQRMVEITTLIGQFSNLVSAQQEDIWDIAKNAEQTKENMNKGQENLVDATERSKRSKHYMAWSIFTLSLLLLFFNSLWN